MNYIRQKKIESTLIMTAIAVLLPLASTAVAANPLSSVMQPAYADDGLTFKKIKNISKNDGRSFNPQIAVSGNNVYVV
jgi:hypothetical protein